MDDLWIAIDWPAFEIQIAVRQSRSGARCPTIVVACSKAVMLAFQY
jgi:hypothetical protein